MRKLIIGLGNPGEYHEKTRHNTGIMFIDYILSNYTNYREGKLKHSNYYKVDNELILIKPNTYMNNSGLAVKEAVKWLDINIERDLILAHDDLDIPLGKYKFQFAKSPKVHNGVKSVEYHLGTNKFYRIRIGIENRGDKKIDGEMYVLSNFNSNESTILNEILAVIINELKI